MWNALTAPPTGDRHPVATHQAAAFVDDGVARFPKDQTFVNRPGELIGLGPERMAIGKVPQLAIFEPLAGQFKVQKGPLGVERSAGVCLLQSLKIS